MTTKSKKTLVARMIEQVLARKRQPPLTPAVSPPVSTPSSGAATELEVYLSEVAATHAEVASRARRDYMDALHRLAPPRTGPAPAPGAHALAEAPTEPPPTKEALAALLEAVGKTPDDLRSDLAALVRLREKADLVASTAALHERSRALDREIDAVEADYRKVQAEFASRRGTLEFDRRSCELSLDRAGDACHELGWDQHLEDELVHARRNKPHASCLIPGSTADQARTAWNEALEEVTATLRDGSPRLEYLERVFFPPPPLPDDEPTPQTIEWARVSREDDE